MIHLTVSAPTRTPQRLLDLVNQHDCVLTHGGTRSHAAPSGRVERVTLPAGCWDQHGHH